MRKPGPKPRQYPAAEIEMISREYAAGRSVLSIADDIGRSRKYVQSVMKRAGIKPRVAKNTKQSGPLNPNWRGDDAGYDALHRRLYTRFGKPSSCAVCNTTEAKRFDYANLSGRYEDIEDYAPMCRSCHAIYDSRHKNLAARIAAKKEARRMK